MGVVNSNKSWDNQPHKKRRFPLKSMLMAFVVSGLFGFALFPATPSRAHSKIQPISVVLSTPSNVLGISSSNETVQLLPESSDLGDLLMDKLMTPPPPPPRPDCQVVACVALTFDDGPDATSTPKILNALDHEGVTATFFLIGSRVGSSAAVVQRMYADGFAIGNHSWAHPDFTRLNAAQMQQQIDMAQNAITLLGIPAPKIFRPPYGTRNNLMRAQIKLPIIMWSVDPKDWRETDPNRISDLVTSQAKPGAIILMHDRVPTADALPKILRELKTRYRLVTVEELMNLTADSHGEFFGR